MIIKNANVWDDTTFSFFRADLLIRDGMIAAVGNLDGATDDCVIDAEGKPVIPGFVDVHTHGGAGHDFVAATAEDFHGMARFYASHGVTSVMPTLASAPLPEMEAAAAALTAFTPAADEADFCGVHLEGRYLNPTKKGAHAPHLLAPLNAEELDCEGFRNCRAIHITAAYELDTDGSFANAAKAIGATMGLGHTAATYAEAKAAEERGISSYTHLFNTMPPLHHRDGGTVCAALEGDRFAELICDGIHIAPEMVRLAARLKGRERLVLVSDSMEATGSCDGEYFIAGNPVVVKNGKALTPEGALAGSTLTLDVALRNLMKFTGMSLGDAVSCVTANPAKQVGVFDRIGSIAVGKQADLLILSGETEPQVETVILRGVRRA